MSKGRAKLRAIGLTPIGLDIDEASAYVGLSARSFRDAVAAGIYPPAMKGVGRRKVWNRLALEVALGAQRAERDPIMEMIDDALRSGIPAGRTDIQVLSRGRRKATATGRPGKP